MTGGVVATGPRSVLKDHGGLVEAAKPLVPLILRYCSKPSTVIEGVAEDINPALWPYTRSAVLHATASGRLPARETGFLRDWNLQISGNNCLSRVSCWPVILRAVGVVGLRPKGNPVWPGLRMSS